MPEQRSEHLELTSATQAPLRGMIPMGRWHVVCW